MGNACYVATTVTTADWRMTVGFRALLMAVCLCIVLPRLPPPPPPPRPCPLIRSLRSGFGDSAAPRLGHMFLRFFFLSAGADPRPLPAELFREERERERENPRRGSGHDLISIIADSLRESDADRGARCYFRIARIDRDTLFLLPALSLSSPSHPTAAVAADLKACFGAVMGEVTQQEIGSSRSAVVWQRPRAHHHHHHT